jgi:hypothetical protein
MKRIILFLGTIALVSVITMHLQAEYKQDKKEAPKLYRVELSIQEWNHVFAAIEMSKSALKRSDIPSKEMVFINDSLMGPIQSAFVAQINKQIDAEKAAQQKKDTTKPKKQ